MFKAQRYLSASAYGLGNLTISKKTLGNVACIRMSINVTFVTCVRRTVVISINLGGNKYFLGRMLFSASIDKIYIDLITVYYSIEAFYIQSIHIYSY